MRVMKALGAIAVLLAILVVPPWALITVIGNPYPPEGVSLSAPLTDGAILGLLAVIVWVLWIQLVVCVVAEAIAVLTDGRVQVRAPLTLGIQQQLARRLVTAIVVAAVPASVAVTGTDAAATPPPAGESTQQIAIPQERQPDGSADQHTAEEVAKPATRTEPVVRLDTLWDIAERTLGDADRWPEIAALNEGRVMNDGAVFNSADTIRPGWELLVPDEAPPTSPNPGKQVTVEAGDTLSDVAQAELGDADRWPEIFEASKGIEQSGGRRLTDPDHIEPGWELLLSADAANLLGRRADETERVAPQHEAREDDRRSGRGRDGQDGQGGGAGSHGATGADEAQHDQPSAPAKPAIPAAPSQGASQGMPDAEHVSAEADVAEKAGGEGEITGLRALLATAACLSVGALGLVIANRRRQFRRRRIGRTIASTPDELVGVEQAIIENGSKAQQDVEFLDRALRHVAASCQVAGSPLPQLGAAVLGDEDLTLLFTHPAAGQVPEGWSATDDARAWMLPRWTFLEEELEAQPAPYPALVTVGQDEGGRTWLLDLETLGVCGIGGDPEQVADFARFMVAELAVNDWAKGCEVQLNEEFAAEAIRLNPARLRQVDPSDALARAAVLTREMGEGEHNLDADVLTRRRDGLLLDTTSPVVVVLASRPEGEFLSVIEDRDRSRLVVVHGDEESPAVELSGDGMAFLPMWGISVKALTLKPEHVAPMADLLAATRNLEDEPVPDTQSDEGPLGKYARADGSLREEYTEARRTEGNDPSSMLPDADEVYLATAATTAEDLAAAAPSVPDEVRAEIAALDPTLDQDVADWFDESSPRPKVHLLGPVSVTARNGGDPAAIDNTGGTVSFIAYLAVQDHGVTGERAAEACGWKTQKTVQNRATNARFLLGTRPNGSDWLPDASMSAGARRGTSPTYELVRGTGGVLNNADLFVRLKHRAERRGDNGCEEDLVTALSLVTGAPFEAATEHRFKWLFKPGQQRHDEILVGAIHDAAHILANRAVTAGRTDLVRLACDAARKASPHSDIAWLDQAAATEAESGREAAGELVREEVLDRLDEDLPPRSETVVEQREWGAAG